MLAAALLGLLLAAGAAPAGELAVIESQALEPMASEPSVENGPSFEGSADVSLHPGWKWRFQ